MPSVYRTALGKQIDIDKIRLLNEDTVAIGNMRVNARGDSIDHTGQVIESKDERVINSKQNKTYNTVVDEPVADSRAAVKPRQQNKENADLQYTIEKLQRELAEKDEQLKQTLGKSLREAVADDIIVNENIEIANAEEVLTPTSTTDAPSRGGLATAIQKNLELQAKKNKPKRI